VGGDAGGEDVSVRTIQTGVLSSLASPPTTRSKQHTIICTCFDPWVRAILIVKRSKIRPNTSIVVEYTAHCLSFTCYKSDYT
jgi:hypothetical protein